MIQWATSAIARSATLARGGAVMVVGVCDSDLPRVAPRYVPTSPYHVCIFAHEFY